MTLIRRCAWCGKIMGSKPSIVDGITGGICPECAAEMGEQLEEEVPEETRLEYEDWLLYEDRIALPETEPIDEDY